MIKRILVALDPDTDTTVATRYAIEIAQRYDAEVTGLAVVDLGNIESGARGGGIGSMYYAEKLRDRLTEETRTKANELVQAFEEVMSETDVRFNDRVREGVPFERILEDMKYHDLLVVGDDPHFFYSRPKKRTDTLARVVKETIAPTLVVEDRYEPVQRVLVAYDGSDAAAHTLQRFIHLQPFGTDIDLRVLSVYEDNASEAELYLDLACGYLEAHGFKAKVSALQGDKPHELIIQQAVDFKANVIVAGAHAVSKLRQFAFGSTTASLLETCPVSLFLHH